MGFSDHHVAVHEDVLDSLVDALEDGRTHCDVGDKVTIHDVCTELRGRVIRARVGSIWPQARGMLTHVDPLGAALLHAADLIAQVGKVGGQDGGRDDRSGLRSRHDETRN